MLSRVLRRLLDLLLLLLGLSTLLFFLLRATGDPVSAMAGEDADEETVQALRIQYGFDRPVGWQLVAHVQNLLLGEFGVSLTSGRAAMDMVLAALPATLLLAALAMSLTILIAIPVGAWLGAAPKSAARTLSAALVYVLQGTPGFVVALILVQLLAIQANVVPALGFAGPETWILPAVSLSLFLAPKLARVVQVNLMHALRQDFVRAARASGASPSEVLWRHALPNALIGAAALMGTQFAALIGGSVIIETIFAWPGLGLLLVQSSLTLDFPVIQAAAIVVAMLVFVANALTDIFFVILDPRIRSRVSQ